MRAFVPSGLRLLALLGAVFLSVACGQKGDNFALTLLHTNDMHANYGGFTSTGGVCYAPACPEGQGGIVRLQREVNAIRQQTPHTLLLDAGDQFMGALYFTRYKDMMAATMLDALRYDACVPGNHEFDNGCDLFVNYMKRMRTPVLAANLTLPKETPEPWRIVRQDGRDIAIIGLVTPETVNSSSPCPEAQFLPEEAQLRRAVAEVQAKGVNIVVVLSHLGLKRDLELASAVSGVDVIVGGHSHSLLSNSPAEKDRASGPYPMVRQSPAGEPVLVVTARHSGLLLGRLDTEFSAQGVLTSWSGNPIPLTGEEGLNADTAALIQGYSMPLQDWLTKPAGVIPGGLIVPGTSLDNFENQVCRKQECLTANVVTDVLRSHLTPERPPQIVLLNGGGLRQSLKSGPNSVGDVYATLPFADDLAETLMPGSVLLAALEHGVSGVEVPKGFFLHASGLRYVFDPQKPVGSRLVSAEVQDASGACSPVKPKAVYRVVTIAYLARGGDGFAMFKDLQWTFSSMAYSDFVRDNLVNVPEARLDGRIQVRSGVVQP